MLLQFCSAKYECIRIIWKWHSVDFEFRATGNYSYYYDYCYHYYLHYYCFVRVFGRIQAKREKRNERNGNAKTSMHEREMHLFIIYKYPDREAQTGVGKNFNGDRDYLDNFRGKQRRDEPSAIAGLWINSDGIVQPSGWNDNGRKETELYKGFCCAPVDSSLDAYVDFSVRTNSSTNLLVFSF